MPGIPRSSGDPAHRGAASAHGPILAGEGRDDAGGRTKSLLADELSKIKSMLTVNTSSVGQAIDAMMEYSAREHSVLWTPMHHFYEGTTGLPALRLSCSVLTPQQIEIGLDRFADLVADVAAPSCQQ